MSGLSSRAPHAAVDRPDAPDRDQQRDRDHRPPPNGGANALGSQFVGGRPLRRYPLPLPSLDDLLGLGPIRPVGAGELDPRRGVRILEVAVPDPVRAPLHSEPDEAEELGHAHGREEGPAEEPERQEARVPHRVLGPLHEEHAEHDRGDEQDERGASPVDRGRDDADRSQHPDPPRQPQRLLHRLTCGVRRGAEPAHDPFDGSADGPQPVEPARQGPVAGRDLLLVPHALRHVVTRDERERPDRRERDRDGADRERQPPGAAGAAGEEHQRREQHEHHRHDDVRHRRQREEQRRDPGAPAGIERLAERAEREQAEGERERERELACEGAGDVAAVDLPVVAGLHERPGGCDREQRRRGPGSPESASEDVRARGEQQRARRRDQLERDVVRDERDQVDERDQHRREGEVVVPDREAGVPVG